MTLHIIFDGQIDQNNSRMLIHTITDRMKHGENHFVLHISSPGGNVYWGITLHNFLKGIPARVETNNLASSDSIAIVVYCSGEKRYSAPNARFMIHGVGITLPANTRLEEKQLNERLESLKTDADNIARIIASHSDKSEEEIKKHMYDGVVLNPEQAQEYGLVHEIREKMFEEGEEVIHIP